MNYESQTCQVTKRCGYNADGTVYALGTEVVKTYTYPEILLGEGNYTISILGYQYGYIFTRLMAKNIYTTQFYTKAETNSLIEQTSSSIDLSVNQKLTNYSTTNEMNSAINVKANQITSQVSETYETKNSANTNYSSLNQRANSIESTVSQKVGNNEIISKINQSAESVTINASKISLAGKTINMTSDDIAINSTNFKVDKNGNLTCSNSNVNGRITSNNATITGGSVVLNGNTGSQLIKVQRNNSNSTMAYVAPDIMGINNNSDHVEIGCQSYPSVDVFRSGVSGTYISHTGIRTPTVTQTSKESTKKNIKKYEKNALNIVVNSEIYEYNYKFEDNRDKKHIGFIIGGQGGNYKTPDEVIAQSKEGIDNNTMISILWKAVQEQQETIETLQKETIEKLQKEIEILKGGKINE